MDKQTIQEIAALKDRINDLGQRMSEHYMGLHEDSTENISVDQDALMELDARITALEEAILN